MNDLKWEYVNTDNGIGQLPEEQVPVLIYSPNPLIGGIGLGKYVGKGHWKVADVGMLMTIQVTHWRPLPVPPKKKEVS